MEHGFGWKNTSKIPEDSMETGSFWTARDMPHHPQLRGRIEADVAIAGGGLTGLTCALWLSRAGLRVTVLEARTLGCCASSQCAGIVSLSNRLLFSHLGKQRTEAVAQTMKKALQSVRDLAQNENTGWHEIDVRLVNADEETFQAEAESLMQSGIDAKLETGKDGAQLVIESMGMLDPARYLHHLAKSAEKLGTRIFEGSRVISIETHVAYTEQGSVQAPYIVVATGYPIINVPGWYFLKIQQRQGAMAPLYGNAGIRDIWVDAMGRYAIRPIPNGALMHCFSEIAGKPDAAHLCVQQIRRVSAEMALPPASEMYAGIECCTPDELPYIGPYGRKTPDLFVAAGYGGRGILGSMTAAQAIAARILGLPSEGYEIYSGQRSMSSMRVPLSIGSRYVKGAVLHPSAPRCPHMGCRLVHNRCSGLWECPCHGSRFDDIGHVINAPAVKDAILQDRR